MKFHYIYVNFVLWLKRNESRFSVKPFIRRVTKDSFVVGFETVECISIHFYMGGDVVIPAFYAAELFDIISDFPIYESKEGNQYFCKMCNPCIYFQTRDQLWEDHVYEPLLDWVNENIRPGHYLCYYGSDGWSSAKIIKDLSLLKDIIKIQKLF